jgi:NifU-like protein involved in Fe-S cluster formation
MLYRETIAVCSQIHTKHINTLCGQNVELYIKIQSVPRSKHSVSVIKTGQLMLYTEIIAVCSQIHTKRTNTLCGHNVELYIKIQFAPHSKHTPSRL